MKPPIPILRSFDEAATREFYIGFLGFEMVFEHRFAPDAPLYLGEKKGSCELHLSEHFGDSTPGAALRIEVGNVQEYAKALRAKNYKNSRPEVQHQEWGWDDMTIADPSGNRLIFCTAHKV